MKRNIFGNIYLEAIDYLPLLLDEFNSQPHYEILVNENTSHGFSTNVKVPEKGIYCIYKNDNALYVGCTQSSIRNRLGRFIAAVRGTEHPEESHAGGYKYRSLFGDDLSGVTFKYCNLDSSDLPNNLSVKDVEYELIKSIKPLFNNETFYDYNFKKVVEVSLRKENA
jgi:hypothetical protein